MTKNCKTKKKKHMNYLHRENLTSLQYLGFSYARNLTHNCIMYSQNVFFEVCLTSLCITKRD